MSINSNIFKCLSRLVLNKRNYAPKPRLTWDNILKDNHGHLRTVYHCSGLQEQPAPSASNQIHGYTSTDNSSNTIAPNDIHTKEFDFQNIIRSKFNTQRNLPISTMNGKNSTFLSCLFYSTMPNSQSAISYRGFSSSNQYRTLVSTLSNKHILY